VVFGEDTGLAELEAFGEVLVLGEGEIETMVDGEGSAVTITSRETANLTLVTGAGAPAEEIVAISKRNKPLPSS